MLIPRGRRRSTAALTGGLHGKDANPNLPEQPEEIARDAEACVDAGASILHVHARDEAGEPTADRAVYRGIIDRIHDRCDDVLVNVTSAGSAFTRDERLRPILDTDPGPDLATIDMGPLNVGDSGTATHTRDEIETFARRMRRAGVKPELELFHGGQFTDLHHLVDAGLVDEPYLCNLVLGLDTGAVPRPYNLLNLVSNLPDGALWTATATGRHQLPLTTMAAILGGHVRVGLEDNVYYRKGELAESNAQLVRRAARIAAELERPVASPEETRAMLGL